MKELTQILNNRVENYKNMVSKIVDIDNELFSVIQESKKELTSSCHASSLSPSIQKIVDEIYKKKSLESISGQDGKYLLENMQRIN